MSLIWSVENCGVISTRQSPPLRPNRVDFHKEIRNEKDPELNRYTNPRRGHGNLNIISEGAAHIAWFSERRLFSSRATWCCGLLLRVRDEMDSYLRRMYERGPFERLAEVDIEVGTGGKTRVTVDMYVFGRGSEPRSPWKPLVIADSTSPVRFIHLVWEH